ncbi:MAG: UDP-glucose/GDP-mannose dehydrogenase family protein [Acidobacteria bacterium]|nr:UDP-glucose/GDP-mannose dehydrogenase family protein [Acidobacteriota bacterium]MCW5948946.1 UDP-glucose/GDP-mannose dehydrogenase family protein [Pyrinomonadaceae bacterium]
MHIAIIGTGYVGLVSGACFAEFGIDVTCVDVDAEKIDKLHKGIIPIYEPGLDNLVEKNVEAGRLHFTTNIAEAVKSAEVVFLAVGTPPKEDGSPDMSYYRQAAKDVAENLTGYTVIVTKSTVPVGTGKWLKQFVAENAPAGIEFGVASNPEFLREGAAIEDFMRPDRVVIGSNEARAIEVMKELYRPLYLIETPIVITSLEAAELIKYAANAFLATKITFINEIANLCDAIGCDVHDVARGMGMDNRIGRKFLHPGPGYGGSCFPKDTRALTTVADQFGVETRIVDAVIEANEVQRDLMVPKIEKLAGGLSGKQIGVLGLAFKPETDDMRESPAVDIIKKLQEGGARVRAFDPVAMDEARHLLPDIEYAADEYDAVKGADVMVIVTEWNQFRALDLDRIRTLLASPKIADLRNVYEPQDMRELGFDYIGVGR